METVRRIVCALLVSLCSHGVDKSDQAAPTMDDLTVTRDLPYAPGDHRSLDIYAPRGPRGPRPVVMYFYGGGWTSGSKEGYAWVGAALARRGFVAVVADYRLYPRAHWPQFLQDCAAAVKWVHDHAAEYGGDPSALVLMGHSAGAYNVFSLAIDRRWLEGAGLDPGRDVKAVIGLSGPYTMVPSGTLETAIFDVGHGYTEPVDHVDGKSPPLLLMIGDEDRAAEPRNSDEVAAKVRAKGGIAEVIHYAGLAHSDTQDALASAGAKKAPVTQDILRFLAAHGVVPPPP